MLQYVRSISRPMAAGVESLRALFVVFLHAICKETVTTAAAPINVGTLRPSDSRPTHSVCDCIACARVPTAAWSMPVAAQNRITRSCALSFVVAFAMACSRRDDALRAQRD